MYDEVSHRTPALGALQLKITEIFPNTFRYNVRLPTIKNKLSCSAANSQSNRRSALRA